MNYDPKGAREGSVEVTTDTAAKRGLAVSEERWQGWLYTGGHAVLCSPRVNLASVHVERRHAYVCARLCICTFTPRDCMVQECSERVQSQSLAV